MATASRSFDPNFSRSLDIESLISAPLVAVSKANVVMAQGQTRFLLDYCFTKVDDESYEPVLIKMAISKSVVVPLPAETDEDGNPVSAETKYTTETVTSYFSLPLLTIVPLNSLVVDKVNIDFDLEISSYVGYEPAVIDDRKKITEKKAQLFGKITNDSHDRNVNQNRSSVSNKIKVNLNAATLPLPSGVLSIIELYNRAIHVAETK